MFAEMSPESLIKKIAPTLTRELHSLHSALFFFIALGTKLSRPIIDCVLRLDFKLLGAVSYLIYSLLRYPGPKTVPSTQCSLNICYIVECYSEKNMGLGVGDPAQVLIPFARNYMTSVKLFNLSALQFFIYQMELISTS